MSRNPEYQFVSTDTETLEALLVASYEKMTGISMTPASPERLFIKWVTAIILQERVLNNYTGNQNIPSRAEGENLDALGELFYLTERPQAQPAMCTERFYISEAQATPILVPAGTRVTDASRTLVWETVSDAYIPAGETYVDTQVRCQETGVIGNGYAIGQINTVIDVYDYYSGCENITVSDDGSDIATDEEYYELMRSSQDAYTTAGSEGSYIYHAKRVSTEIADVVVTRPAAGCVALYVLMADGKAAGTEIKNAVLAACTPSRVRPLTDSVSMEDPETVEYNVNFQFFIPQSSPRSSAEMLAAVDKAVENYVAWQSGKLGRDINPDKLREYLAGTGIKRIELSEPVFTRLRDGKDNSAPQIATLGTVTVTNGGYEDE